jgi:DNA-directed RNA polymerase specialized sigma24 family protein
MITDGSRQNDLLSSYLLKEKISTAYMVLLHQLNWTERVVFILREVLQYDYEEIINLHDVMRFAVPKRG